MEINIFPVSFGVPVCSGLITLRTGARSAQLHIGTSSCAPSSSSLSSVPSSSCSLSRTRVCPGLPHRCKYSVNTRSQGQTAQTQTQTQTRVRVHTLQVEGEVELKVVFVCTSLPHRSPCVFAQLSAGTHTRDIYRFLVEDCRLRGYISVLFSS